jgi:DNA-binding NarL/FixJ family response regulator
MGNGKKKEMSGGEVQKPRRVVKVLVLCGDSDFGRMLKEVLRSEREVEATVDIVGSMDTAKIMIEAGYAPDVFFCDCGGASRSGLEFFAWVAAAHPDWAKRFCLVVQNQNAPELEALRQKGCHCMSRMENTEEIVKTFNRLLSV